MSTKNWGFCDLGVDRNFSTDKLHLFAKNGFNTIAINTKVTEETNEEPKKKKKKGEIKEKKDFIPEPITLTTDLLSDLKVNILQRVTIELSDSSVAHKLNQSENIKKYDIIAVIPKSLQAFQYVCGTLDVDIISFDPEGRIPFKVSRKQYRQATERGIFFELMYSPVVKDATARKNTISTAHLYHAIGKSRNIVVTSGAENERYVRSVYDVINLGFLLGLTNNESLEVIRNNTRKLILKAEGRKCGKYYIKVSINQDSVEEGLTPS